MGGLVGRYNWVAWCMTFKADSQSKEGRDTGLGKKRFGVGFK
jgi:hypothetical protein